MKFDMVLSGVGGQGTLLAAEALGAAAVNEGLNVRISEIHGMAQRGGSVVTTVRFGEAVLAPTVLEGQADMIVGFEPLEALRSLRYASEKTVVVVSSERIPPVELAAKGLQYPSMEEIVRKIRVFTDRVVLVDAAGLAVRAGSILVRSVVMLGAVVGLECLPVSRESVAEAVRELVPPKALGVNLEGFRLGCESVRGKLMG